MRTGFKKKWRPRSKQKLRFDGHESYAEYLQGKHWASVKKDRKPAGAHCSACSSTEQLELHHVDYGRLGHELPSDLLLVCRTCHAAIHAQLDKMYPDRGILWKVRQTDKAFRLLFNFDMPVKQEEPRRKKKQKQRKVKDKRKDRRAIVIQKRQESHARILAEKDRAANERRAAEIGTKELTILALPTLEQRIRARIRDRIQSPSSQAHG